LFYTPAQNKQKFLEKERSILRIIKEYSPKIKEQCINYEKYFFQWERENKSGGNNQWAIKKEREALEKIDVLYKEEKEKLELINEMIEFIHPLDLYTELCEPKVIFFLCTNWDHATTCMDRLNTGVCWRKLIRDHKWEPRTSNYAWRKCEYITKKHRRGGR